MTGVQDLLARRATCRVGHRCPHRRGQPRRGGRRRRGACRPRPPGVRPPRRGRAGHPPLRAGPDAVARRRAGCAWSSPAPATSPACPARRRQCCSGARPVRAVLTTGDRHLGLVPSGRASWVAVPVSPDRRARRRAARGGARARRRCPRRGSELARLDVARWDPAAAEVLQGRVASGRTSLPPSAGPAAHALLAQGLRITRLVEVALASDGAAVTGGESTAAAAGAARPR